MTWTTFIPSLLYVFFVGALCDKFGLRWLVIIPVLGYSIGGLFGLFNAIFVEQIPLEMFLLNEMGWFFGGMPTYYLGIYGIGSAMASPRRRPHVLTRLDGFERIAITAGIAASPRMAEAWGYVTNFAFKFGCITLALIYAIIFVKNPIPPQRNSFDRDEKDEEAFYVKIWKVIDKYVVQNVIETMQTLFKARPFHMRFMILFQLGLYACAIMTVTERKLNFLYIQM